MESTFKKIGELSDPFTGNGQYDQMYADHYKTQQYPHISDLLNSYKRINFACANINANGCAGHELKLFVKTRSSDKKTVLNTAKVGDDKQDFLRQEFKIKDSEVIEEVIEHPVLGLLKEVNDEPFLNSYTLKALTFLYFDIASAAYWWVDIDKFLNRPKNIWILPSQHVLPKRESGSDKIVDYYEYVNGDKVKRYSPEEIIQFIPLGVKNPYLEGIGSAEGSYEASLLSNKLASMTSHLLDNDGRPDILYSPKEGIGAAEATGLEKRLNQKYSQGRSGGWHVADEPADIKPMNYPPRDIARLDINEQAKIEICNAYSVPVAFLDNRNISRETIFGALTLHAIFGIKPRLGIYAETLNKRLIPFYDESGRLFFGYDDPVPEDKEAKLAEVTRQIEVGMIEPNEGRKKYNLPPHSDPEASRLKRINAPGLSGAGPRQASRESGEAEK